MNINQKAERVYELAEQFGFEAKRSSESMIVIQKERVDPIVIELIDAEPIEGTIRIKGGTVVQLHEVSIKFKMLGLICFMSELGEFYIASTDNLMHNTYLIPSDQFKKNVGFRAEDDNNYLDKDNVYEIEPTFHPLLEVLSTSVGEFRGIKNHPSISYYMSNRSKTKDLRSSGIMAESL